jgi:hypothetical protein
MDNVMETRWTTDGKRQFMVVREMRIDPGIVQWRMAEMIPGTNTLLCGPYWYMTAGAKNGGHWKAIEGGR